MPEPRTGGFNSAIDQVAAALALCPTYATTLAGGEIILEERSGTPPTGTHAFIALEDPPTFERVDPEGFLGGLTVLVDILWQPYAGLSVADARSRANSHAWSLYADLAALLDVNARACDPSPPVRLGESEGALKGWFSMTISVTFLAGSR